VRSDLYAFGAVLYELLVGTAPHPQTDRDDLRTSIRSGLVQPIHARAPDTPPALARLVMRCLALDPHERPGSAAAIAHALTCVRPTPRRRPVRTLPRMVGPRAPRHPHSARLSYDAASRRWSCK
jgi:serine/threonine protein kinase